MDDSQWSGERATNKMVRPMRGERSAMRGESERWQEVTGLWFTGVGTSGSSVEVTEYQMDGEQEG